MSGALTHAGAQASFHLEKIQKLFKAESKVTLIVRPPMHKVEGDTDFVLTDDDLEQAIAVLERRKALGHQAT